MNQPDTHHVYAAIDLGSNSFHMIVARYEHGELRVIDRIKEMVRLGGGLDRKGHLDPAVRDRALACLGRFGQRIRGLEYDNVRAVGTQALRRMKHAQTFLVLAETALGIPVEIVAGREEARLIYIGVSQGVANDAERNLVIDIGGGSTELIIGEGHLPRLTESLQYGCVGVTARYFKRGRITLKRWKKAKRAVMEDLQEINQTYRNLGWGKAIGSSGTIRAVHAICRQAGWIERAIDRTALDRLQQLMLERGSVDQLNFNGLSQRRQPVFVGGAVILDACFEALDIREMSVSPFALREGVLHDLLGRLSEHDPRENTVQAMASRYGVDMTQAGRVWRTAETLFQAVAEPFELGEVHRRLLRWACQLHEVGLSITHSHYQEHGGYLIRHSDMAGFSVQEQNFLATLVRYHRRKIATDYPSDLPTRLHAPLRHLLVCLRLAVILCRSREDLKDSRWHVQAADHEIDFFLPEGWIDGHPLTVSGLEAEIDALAALQMQLNLRYEVESAEAALRHSV